ncbi:MAG TPA: phage holin family protein [Mycobacteriales bacterium]
MASDLGLWLPAVIFGQTAADPIFEEAGMSDPVAADAATPDARSSGQLALAFTDQVTRLVKDELALAQAEVKAKLPRLGIGAGLLAAAGLLVACGLVALLVGGGLAIALVFPSWLAALIMGGGFVLLAGLLALIGKRGVSKGTPPVPQEAIAGLRTDLALVKRARP